MAEILVVEDDSPLGRGLRSLLAQQGFLPTLVGTLGAARAALDAQRYDLLLLDVRLPDGNGVDFCRALRASDETPVVFLTACDEDTDMVRGLDAGADDYIAKPFSAAVLLSRIRAVLRRAGAAETLTSGGVAVQSALHRVTVGGGEVALTPIEYGLLTALLKSSGRLMTREALLRAVWDMGGEFVEDNTLSVHMLRLRRKLGDDVEEPAYIKTIRGAGYRWLPPVRAGGEP